MRFWEGLDIAYDPVGVQTQYQAARALTQTYDLTVKDAAYLELALRAGAPLATRDRALINAAHRAGVPLAGS